MSPIPAADKQTMSPAALLAEQLDDWRFLAGKIHARFATRTFAVGLALVDQVGAEAEQADHHPDIDLRYTHVDITLRSHDVGGITQRDVRLARVISDLASAAGAAPLTAALQVVTLALDTPDAAEIRPFWMAVLGLRPEKDVDDFLLDPDGHTPGLYLQATDAYETPRQRFHIDIDVAPEVAQARIAQAIEAGGTLVDDTHAPAWWTLSDSQGNSADIATWEGRD
jgi:4a-hydroxytetrahydrobiopterin dehydratase